ncbi:MAG: hypothetical protein U0744_15600 [Gemmataceae bacterium]
MSAVDRSLPATILSSIAGLLTSIPLVARDFPRWTSRLMTAARSCLETAPHHAADFWEGSEQPGPKCEELGFSLEEMANIGERVLRASV